MDADFDEIFRKIKGPKFRNFASDSTSSGDSFFDVNHEKSLPRGKRHLKVFSADCKMDKKPERLRKYQPNLQKARPSTRKIHVPPVKSVPSSTFKQQPQLKFAENNKSIKRTAPFGLQACKRAKKTTLAISPECLKRSKLNKTNKVTKTTEELEMEHVKQLQKEMSLHLKSNQATLKRIAEGPAIGPQIHGTTKPTTGRAVKPATSRATKPNTSRAANPTTTTGTGKPTNNHSTRKPAIILGTGKPTSTLGTRKPTTTFGAGKLTTTVGAGKINTKRTEKLNANRIGKLNTNGIGKLNTNGTGKLNTNGTGKLNINGTGKLNINGTGKLNTNGTGKLNINGTGKLNINGTGKLYTNGTAKPTNHGTAKPTNNYIQEVKPSTSGHQAVMCTRRQRVATTSRPPAKPAIIQHQKARSNIIKENPKKQTTKRLPIEAVSVDKIHGPSIRAPIAKNKLIVSKVDNFSINALCTSTPHILKVRAVEAVHTVELEAAKNPVLAAESKKKATLKKKLNTHGGLQLNCNADNKGKFESKLERGKENVQENSLSITACSVRLAKLTLEDIKRLSSTPIEIPIKKLIQKTGTPLKDVTGSFENLVPRRRSARLMNKSNSKMNSFGNFVTISVPNISHSQTVEVSELNSFREKTSTH